MGQVGGGVFRCRTCPRAWCETCLPGGLDATRIMIDDCMSKSNASPYIHCSICLFSRKRVQSKLAAEPTRALDLSGFSNAGDANQVFAFLDNGLPATKVSSKASSKKPLTMSS